MDEKYVNKLIGYAVVAIVAYFVLQMIVPYLMYGVVGMVVWRIYLEKQKHKRKDPWPTILPISASSCL